MTERPAGTTGPEPAPDRADVPRPQTGDRVVDDALAAFDRAAAEGPSAHVEAATEAHRALQARLTTSPAEPPPPGQARPGPRP